MKRSIFTMLSGVMFASSAFAMNTTTTTDSSSSDSSSSSSSSTNSSSSNDNTSTASSTLSNGRYVIKNKHSGKVLDVDVASTEDGANIIQYDYLQGDHQHWDLNDLGNGYYSIRAAHSGKSLDVYEWNPDDGADARQWSFLNGENQQWQINALGNGYHSIISRFSGKALEVFDFSTENAANIVLWSYWSGDPQQWELSVAGNSSSSSNNSSSSNSGNSRGSSCQSSGNQTVSSTIVISGITYDGGCKTFNPTSALGDGGQAEGQKPVFRVENGATLKNVIIGLNGADGIHFYNGGTIDNIHWTDVGEDALTVKSAGNVTVRNIEGYNGHDKFMQINAATNLKVSNCIVDNMGKFLRQNGGTGFTISVDVDNCQISNMKEAVFRTDSSTSTAHISNSSLKNIGKICYGSWRSCTSSNITNY